MRLCQKPRKGNALNYCITSSNHPRGFIAPDRYPLVSAQEFLPAVVLPVFPSLLLPASTLPAALLASGLCSSLLLGCGLALLAVDIWLVLLEARAGLVLGISLLWSSEWGALTDV